MINLTLVNILITQPIRSEKELTTTVKKIKRQQENFFDVTNTTVCMKR